jgi:hypothetical protein
MASDVEIIFTPWPFDADGNDLSRVVTLSREDAGALLELALDVQDRSPAEVDATVHLIRALLEQA